MNKAEILLASINHFIKRVDRAHKTSLTPPLVIEVTVTSHEGERSCIVCVMGIDCASFYEYTNGYWNCYDSVVFIFVFHYIIFYSSLIKANVRLVLPSGCIEVNSHCDLHVICPHILY